MRWIVSDADPGEWVVVLIDEHGSSQRVHPITFSDEREANRAASRLNMRDGVEP